MTGKTLSHYEIQDQLGAGGMGEVYRARDMKLGRSVAVKVLPAAFASDPDRISRFEREAKLLASLNHPNIAALHGMDVFDGTHFLVMELIEGETLADRMVRGRIPIDDALGIAHQIAEALEAAHEKGIVHRDLKPANVKIAPDDTVKVLDFGLAKALENAPATTTLANSPTLSVAATQAGVILGTAAYMSPEQAKGFPVDARSDIFSFGCVLYEMLTGKQPFHGETAAEVMASVLVRDTDWSALPANLNPRVTELLRRCLEKNPKRRWQAAGDLRAELESLVAIGGSAVVASAAAPTRNYWKAAALFSFLGMIGLAMAAVALYRPPVERQVIRFSVSLPDKTNLANPFAGAVLSPDGRHVAFVARSENGRNQLWIHALDSLTARLVPDTDGVVPLIFWSPDSRSVAFVTQNKLRRVQINGGGIQSICDVQALVGGTWNANGVIVFAQDFGGPLYRVPANGGSPIAVTKLDGHANHRLPQFLPDGRRFLYLAVGGEMPEILVGDLESSETKRLFTADTAATFVEPGLLLFVRQGVLLAQQFDTRSLETVGEPRPIAEPVAYNPGGPNVGLSGFSVSNTGVLAYRTGGSQLIESVRLMWMDRSGKELEQVGEPGPYRGVELSPDERRLAVHRHDGTGGDLWVFERQRPAPLRLTFDASQENSSPLWSQDGKTIAFASLRGGMWGIYQKPADGAGEEQLLFQTKLQIMPKAWSPDGKVIVFWQRDTSFDLWTLPLGGERKPQPFLNSRFAESHGQVSPNGKWISYNSNETGRPEIHVRPFPSGPGQWQVSTSGGVFSRWRADGKELYYLTSASRGKLMAIEIKDAGGSFEYGTATELFDSQYENYNHANGGNWHTYAVTRDGQRFLIPRPLETAAIATGTSFNVVLNWPLLLTK